MTANRAVKGDVSHREVLAIALPIILSNATQPLIGIVDTAVLGQLDQPHLLGAVALGATIFTMLYWAFGFLRMGTSGLTAQADGANDQNSVASTILQALAIAAVAGIALVALQKPVAAVAMALLQGSPAVEDAARNYLTIRIWSAPFALANFAMLGWLVGLRRIRSAFVLQILINGSNIILDIVFVTGMGMGVEGVAYGTLLAELIAACAGLLIVRQELIPRSVNISTRDIFSPVSLARVFAVNRDIMIRTVFLIFAFAFFVNEGARSGDTILAANAILYHIMGLSAYVLDGFAYAAEALVGHAAGANNRLRFFRAVKLSTLWSGLLSLVLGLLFWISGPVFIDLLTVTREIRETARIYLLWAAFTPVAGFACFQLDGIFVGATRTADMRNSTIISVAAYLASWAVLTPMFANHGLWATMYVLYAARAITLGARFPGLARSLFPPGN